MAFVALVTPGVASTHAATRTYIVAERSLPSGGEQTALIFDGARAQFLANSDFLQPALEGRRVVRLGFFESSLNDKLARALKDIETVAAEPVPDSAASRGGEYESPHALKVYIGSRRLSPANPAYSRVLRILGEASELADWKTGDGTLVSVSPRGGLEATPTAKGPVRIECSNDGRSCIVGKLGYVHPSARAIARRGSR